MLISNNGAA